MCACLCVALGLKRRGLGGESQLVYSVVFELW